MTRIEGIDADSAKRIVESLRAGNPPREHLRQLTVGRGRELEYFGSKLDDVAAAGLSEVKFVSAGYGAGKSHFLDVIRTLALERNFAVSKVDLDSRGTRFDHFEEVYGKLVRSIQARDHMDDGLDGILRDWGVSLRGKHEDAIERELRAVPGLPIPLRSALFEYGRAIAGGDADVFSLHNDLMAWLQGAKLGIRQKGRLGNPAQIEASNAQEMLHGILQFIRARGYAGFLVLLDEAEAISSMQRLSARDAANANIRAIIDNAGATPGFYFVFATTPSFLDPSAPRSAASYPALWRRIRDPLSGASTSLENSIIELPDLMVEEYIELASRLRSIVEMAKSSQIETVTEDDLGAIASYVHGRGDPISVFVRSVVIVLSRAVEDEGFDVKDEYPFVVQAEIENYQRELAED